MSESESHKRAKNKAAGAGGKTEVPLSRNRYLDALTKDGTRATEIERSGDPKLLDKAVKRLTDSGAPKKHLHVPHKDIPKATEAVKKGSTTVVIKNLGGTQSKTVKPTKK